MISGSGRSGTTILSLLLSQPEDVLNLGQSRDFWRSYADAQICACGHPMPSCPLWSGIVDMAFPDWQTDDLRDMDLRMRAFMQDAGRALDWSDLAAIDALRQTHASYLTDLARFLNAAQDITGATRMVDSSKSPETALAVWMTGADTYVLNVVRDPRAVAVSWARKTGTSRIGKYMSAWRKRQHRLATWPEAPGLHHLQMSYEAFADKPEAALATVAAWTGHGADEVPWTGPRQARLDWTRQHLFPPANERVLAEKLEQLVIRAPDNWRAARYWPLHAKALFLSAPSGPKYVLRRKVSGQEGLS